MSETEAKAVAAGLSHYGAVAENTGGNEWCVFIRKRSGGMVVFSEGGVAEYANQGRYDDGNHDEAIDFE